MSDIYADEKARVAAVLRTFANSKIMIKPSKIEVDDTSLYETDGDIQSGPYRLVLMEAKAEIGATGAEPYFQSQFYYIESTRGLAAVRPDSVLPCLIILVFGSHLSFAGAAWTDRPNFQVLSASLLFHFHRSDTRMREISARHLGAFRRAIKSLETYYEGNISTPNSRPSTRSLFLYQTHFTELVDGTKQHFKYISALVDDKLIFFGQLELGGSNICIKFVRHYCVDAHSFCVSIGVAPKLLGYQSLPGGWHMVVMEKLDHKSYMDYYDFRNWSEFDHSQHASLCEEVGDCLSQLHAAGYVHGDIRGTNLMVTLNDDGDLSFMLVDFDWAGVIGTVKYPMNVNPDVRRPLGAYDGELITTGHDIEMLDYMFSRISM